MPMTSNQSEKPLKADDEDFADDAQTTKNYSRHVLFLNQLRLLLWKNAVLKKRQPFVVALEVFIPLIIFIILVLMRSRLPAEQLPIQMPKPQPLISAGLIPVIQSLCIKEDVCKPYGVPEGSYFHELLTEMSVLHSDLTLPSTNQLQIMLRMLKSPLKSQDIKIRAFSEELTKEFGTLPETSKFTIAYLTNENFRRQLNIHIDKMRDSSLIQNQVDKYKTAGGDLSFTDDKIAMLLQLSDKLPTLLDWLESLPSDTCQQFNDDNIDYDRLQSAALEMWFTIQPNLCENAARLSLEDITLKRLDKLNLQIHQQLMIQHWQAFLEKNLKIIYTPPTADTRRLVDKMSSGVNTLKQLPEMLDNYLNVSSAFRHYIHEQRAKEDANGASMPAGNQYNVTVLDVVKFLRMDFEDGDLPESNENHQETTSINFMRMLDVFDRAACAMKLFLRNRDLDVFKGFESEDSAVDYMVNGQAAKDGNRVLAVLVFDTDSEGRLGQHVSYKIRQLQIDTADTRFVRSIYWYPGPDTHGLNEYNYYTNGFLWVQDIVDRAIINFQTNMTIDEPGLYVQKFPTPCYNKDLFAQVIEHGMPLFMCVSWIYSCCMLVNAIVREKETRLKESMRMMGLTRPVHWTAWFITTFIQMETTLVLLVILIKYGQLLPASDPSVVFAFLTAFIVCSIFFCFLMSCLFSNGQVASAFVGILLLFLYVPFVFFHILETYNKKVIHVAIKAAACVFPVTPLGLGIKYFTIYEIQRVGIQWSNIATSPSDGDNFSVLQAMAMMGVDSVLFAIMTWYIEAVNPGPYGIPLPWYFPLLKSYWSSSTSTQPEDMHQYSMTCTLGCTRNHDEDDDYVLNEDDTKSRDERLFEQEPTHLPLGVAIHNLTKKYKNSGKKVALNDLTMNMYEGQITALLGHNGAGKSTTMSILCGVQPPSSGTAKIYNEDIRFKIENIRRDMGMCPQHNVLFDNLTVEEHLWLFACLKMPHSSPSQITTEINRLLHDMDLPTERDTLICRLSSGVQRKLSVALTFIGDPKLVILDEPTSNVDPQARRAIWDLLIKYRRKHTILMSTHFMDEAQMLGDRIAMISGGVLRCVGTPIYLLNRLGAGYHLTLYKQGHSLATDQPNSSPDSTRPHLPDEPMTSSRLATSGATTRVSVDAVTAYVCSFIPQAILQKQSNTELEYILPREAVEQKTFERLLSDLPQQLRRLHLSSYGIRDTSLEEVFFKICEESELHPNSNGHHTDCNESSVGSERESQTPEHTQDHDVTLASPAATGQNEPITGEEANVRLDVHTTSPVVAFQTGSRESTNKSDSTMTSEEVDEAFKDKRLTGCKLFVSQFIALSKKKLILSSKNPRLFATQVFFPVLFMAAAMSMAQLSSYTGDLPSLRLSTAQYQSYHVLAGQRNMVPVAAIVSQVESDRDNSTEPDLSPAGPLELVSTLQLDSGLGADCTLANRRSNPQQLPDLQAPVFSALPDFLHPEWCLAGYEVEDGSTFGTLLRNNNSFVPLYKQFLSKFPPYRGRCEAVSHVCSNCDNGVLTCSNSSSAHTPFQWDTYSNDRVQDVSIQDQTTGFDVDDQFQLQAYYKFLRNRYGGLVFKDYVYEPGKVADLPDIYNPLFAKKQAKVYYNSKGYHSLPTYVNAANNAILRANVAKFLSSTNRSVKPQHYGITTFSQPIRTGALPSKNIIDHGNDIVVAMLAMVSLSALPGSFLMILVSERVGKMKHLQLVSGMHPVVYWASNFFWDFLVASIPIFINYILIVVFGVKVYNQGNNNVALLLVMLTYVWAAIPTMYSFSFVFSEPAAAYVGLGVANLFCGVTTVIIVYLFDTIVQDDVVIMRVNDILKSVFVIFPIYNVGHGFTYIAFNQFLNDFYRSFGLEDKLRNPFDWDVVTRGIVFNIIEGFLGFAVVILCEYNMFLRISVKTEESNEPPAAAALASFAQDADVKAERERVHRCRDLVRIVNLTKSYSSLQTGRVKAVNGVYLGVQQGEIFGLVGSNGSGKTELFKLLTGDTNPSEGAVFIDNFNALKRKQDVWSRIGYCPQNDALFDTMSARDHLALYSRLRGCPPALIPRVVVTALADIDLGNTGAKGSGEFSGGMKRKLSAAIALLGNPKVVVMDDPTAGMDPRSRRFLWTLIKRLNDNGRTVIFASNSMDECERLCSRLAIMVRGQFICIGSVSYLKNRHGDMYNIKCRLGEDADPNCLAQFMQDNFPHAHIVEEHFNVVTYEISAEHLCLPTVFSLLGGNKTQLRVEDYSVNQKTLEMGYMNILRRELFLMEQNAAKMAAVAACSNPAVQGGPASPRVQGVHASTPATVNAHTAGDAPSAATTNTRSRFLQGIKREQYTGKKLATYAQSNV